MRKDNTLTRVEKIYDVLGRGGYWSTQEITEILGEPKGTISPFISAMEATGNLVNTDHRYTKPLPMVKSCRQVANDIRKHYKKMREETLKKRWAKLEKIKNIVNQVANETPSQLSIDVEKNFKDIAEKVKNQNWDFERVDSFHIEEAVKLLKSKGYKILAPVTEFKEI